MPFEGMTFFASIFLLDILESFWVYLKTRFCVTHTRQTYLSHLRQTYVTVALHLRHQTDLQLCRSYQS